MAKPIPHGTDNGYRHYKCRCEDCKAAHTAKGKQFREANPDYYSRYREANPERDAERKRRWLEANPGYRQRSWEANRERDAEKHRLWVEANSERMSELRIIGAHRYKAQRHGAFVEDVPRSEIFKRDNWQCMIPGCLYPGIPADPDLPWPDPLFASLDHIIPLSRGGLHERANVVCAHLRCNLSKSNRVEGIA